MKKTKGSAMEGASKMLHRKKLPFSMAYVCLELI